MENLNFKKIIISFDHYNSFMRRVLSICLTDENTVYITRVCQRQGLNPDLPAWLAFKRLMSHLVDFKRHSGGQL